MSTAFFSACMLRGRLKY
uniref:Uncharacterized protein n=1 Tax=Arundo donax TaxID=35708 RepID=A0A0A8Y8P3_ARUDO